MFRPSVGKGGNIHDLFRSEEHTSELQSHYNLVCRLLLEKKNMTPRQPAAFTPGRSSPQIPSCSGARVSCHTGAGRARRGRGHVGASLSFFFFNDTATTEIYTLSLHDALPIWQRPRERRTGVGRTTQSR